MLVFDVAQFDGILKKITEFNNNLLSDQVGSFASLQVSVCFWNYIYFLQIEILL